MKTRELGERLQDWRKVATEKARYMGNATDHYVRANTWTTLGLAVMAGCAVGYLLAGRRRD